MEDHLVGLVPTLLNDDASTKLTRSDVALGVVMSPRANELAVHTQILSERTGRNGKVELKAPSLSNAGAVWFAKWGSTPPSSVQLYADAYLTFKQLQLHIAQDPNILEGSRRTEVLHDTLEAYVDQVQEHIDRLALDEPFDSPSYTTWTSVSTTLDLFQAILLPTSGMTGGLFGEELLLWVNQNFVAPTTEDGRKYANKEKPWLEEGFWDYLKRSTMRGLSKGALHFFTVLSKHPSQALRRFAPRLIPILESHPRSTTYATEQEYLSAHRRWKASLRPLKSELNDMPDEEWQRGLVDLMGILDGQREVVLRLCSEEEGGYGWREALSVWGIWVQPDFRRRDLPDTLAVINDTVPVDSSAIDELAQAALVSGRYKRFAQIASDLHPWLGAHVSDVLAKYGIVMHATASEEDDEDLNSPNEAMSLRDFLIMDFAGSVLHSDPTLWDIEFDYLGSCGDVGRARLGALLRRMAVDVQVDAEKEDQEAMDEEGEEEGDLPANLGKLTGMDRVTRLVEICREHELMDEMESLCKVVALHLIHQRRYGAAISFSVYANDLQAIARIVDLLLDEYIEKGADEFVTLAQTIPDVADLLLDSPTFDVGESGASTMIRSRLLFVELYADYHLKFAGGEKKLAARKLVEVLNHQLVPKWWWGVVLVDAAAMCNDAELWFDEQDIYDFLMYVEDISIRTEQGCGEDYLVALEKIVKADKDRKQDKSPAGPGETALKQLEEVRLAFARYLARLFTVGGRAL